MQAWIMMIIEKFGYFGTFFMIFIENVFPPIPSEVILTFGGFVTTTTSLTVPGMIFASTCGSLAGALLLFGLGSVMRIEQFEAIVTKYGHILRLKVEDVRNAQHWFEKRGSITVFICRMIPILRSLISIPAGIARMKLGKFMFLTTIGTLIWNTILVGAGALLGEKWEVILEYMDVYSTVTYTVLGLIGVGLVVYLIRKNRKA